MALAIMVILAGILISLFALAELGLPKILRARKLYYLQKKSHF